MLAAAAAAEERGRNALFERAVVDATVEGFSHEEVRVHEVYVVRPLGGRWDERGVGSCILAISRGVSSRQTCVCARVEGLHQRGCCVPLCPAPVPVPLPQAAGDALRALAQHWGPRVAATAAPAVPANGQKQAAVDESRRRGFPGRRSRPQGLRVHSASATLLPGWYPSVLFGRTVMRVWRRRNRPYKRKRTVFHPSLAPTSSGPAAVGGVHAQNPLCFPAPAPIFRAV